MTDLNSIVLVGRITQEIGENDFGYISTGTAKLTLHIANNESRKKGDNWEDVTSYFDVVYWGKPAENIKAKIHKGLLLGVSGRLKQDTPETAAHQAPPSLGFSRQEHWSGLPFPSPMHESEK